MHRASGIITMNIPQDIDFVKPFFTSFFGNHQTSLSLFCIAFFADYFGTFPV